MKSASTATVGRGPTVGVVSFLLLLLMLLLIGWMYDKEWSRVLWNLWLVTQVIFYTAVHMQRLGHIFSALA